MSLDAFTPADPEIQALLVVSGVRAWKLFGPNSIAGEVYLTMTLPRLTDKIDSAAPIAEWRRVISSLLDAHRGKS